MSQMLYGRYIFSQPKYLTVALPDVNQNVPYSPGIDARMSNGESSHV